MGIEPTRVLTSVVFWTYPRGTWQYDILCILILAFIFFTPKAFFERSVFSQPDTIQEEASPSERI